MPELPEVETIRRGLAPHLIGRTLRQATVRQSRLRRPVPQALQDECIGASVQKVGRRGKYLLFYTERGTLIWHLGMSGSLRILTDGGRAEKHDHIDLVFEGEICLRYRDPRRFGLVEWTEADPLEHPLLSHLGAEPLEDKFDGAYLWHRSRSRKIPLKNFIMDARVVVGVGNIYASEALFQAGLRPDRLAGSLTKKLAEKLAAAIKDVLTRAIEAGGTSLRDFVDGQGQPGYFAQELKVYGRAGQPCPACGEPIGKIVVGQRSSFFCPRCQK
ncbi:bifunctional DNA-formamidopyrimidine glycosylase/DNA-(apurinic or apyrimidinic site) lyase [Geoalkalibacter subterraneus]|uniref:Formamidopyrimidine-DNA glycosylase n=1 Tax=Geoalkalibacter subterraneus TaxID=483547 RepID=A0A0B5FFK4_9BACT|nr:bifunctional DNA-formamidopyrimidine glycosylase/DNA-(apurinic or apyrimidinic site) lyase [Geoalkalibacter subterraneus]AJF06927.1 5-hydroxymethyluracil DNA glycosylase [Geoalkalibacter subterraneus]